ncbi:hypothetical protein [Amycolatopsis rubida]|uniref:hypothetical protein n=1 Tax=Amycolatopsis rubida TaxID=112413 RepID=UPI000B84AC75|nr:hypothetical protein [Amycolatopsis rubida]
MATTTTSDPTLPAAPDTAPRLGTDTLAGRAAHALDRVRRQDPAFDQRPGDVRRAAVRRELAREMTDVFGVAREAVTVTDDPDREHGGWRWFRVTVDDGAEYRFTSFDGTVDDLYVLAPCPDCGGEIPRAAAADLACLGRYLDSRAGGRSVTPAAGVRTRHRPPGRMPGPGGLLTGPESPGHRANGKDRKWPPAPTSTLAPERQRAGSDPCSSPAIPTTSSDTRTAMPR